MRGQRKRGKGAAGLAVGPHQLPIDRQAGELAPASKSREVVVNIPVDGTVGRVFNLKKRGRQHRQQIRLADADQEVAKQDLTPRPRVISASSV